jgi:hypothetical protein
MAHSISCAWNIAAIGVVEAKQGVQVVTYGAPGHPTSFGCGITGSKMPRLWKGLLPRSSRERAI